MTSVRVKFICMSIERRMSYHWNSITIEHEEREMRTVTLTPVSGGSEENKRFWNATPAGTLQLGMINLEAAEAFDIGKEYYLDISPAAAAQNQSGSE